MNNIYKVIWSKAKNCYVVASEIARSHTKSASGSEKIGGVTRRSLLASLMALSLLCGGLGAASATLEVSGTAGTETIYTKNEVDLALAGKGEAKDVAINTAAIADLKKAVGDAGSGLTQEVADQKAAIATNTESLNTNNAAIKSLDGKLANLTTAVAGKANEADVNTKLAKKADATSVFTKDEVNTKLTDYAKSDDVYTITAADGKFATSAALTTAKNELDGKIDSNTTRITDLQTTTAGQAGAIKDLKDRTTNISYDSGKQSTSINGIEIGSKQVDMGGKDLTDVGTINGIALGEKESGNYISKDGSILGNMKNVDTQVGKNVVAIGDNTTAITKLDNKVGKVGAGNYLDSIKSVGENLGLLNAGLEKEVEDRKTSVDAEKTERAKADEALSSDIKKETSDREAADAEINKKIGSIDNNQTEYVKERQTISQNLTKLDNELKDTNDRTRGITRNDAESKTIIEKSVTVDSNGNVTADGKLKAGSVDAGDGAITTTGAVNAGSLNVTNGATSLKETTVNGKLTAKENATFEKNVTVEKDLTVNGKLNVDKISMKNDELKNGKKHDSATTITADEISNLAKVTEQGNTTESQFTHNEKGTFNYARDGNNADWKESNSNVTADRVSNKMTDSDGNRHTYYQTATESKEQLVNGDKSKSNFEKKTAEGNTISITEKDADGNLKSSLTNTQTVNEEKTSVTNKDSSSTINQGADQIRYNVTSKDENKTSSSIEVKADGITNTSKDGTITNDAKDIENNATGDITNTAQNGSIINKAENGNISNTAQNVTNEGTESVTNKVGKNEVKVSKDGVNIKAEDGKKITESVGTASRVVENDKITDKAADSTVTTENGKGTTFGKEGSTGTTNIYGDSIKTGTINAEDTTTAKLTAGAAAGADGGRLTVDANDGVKGSYKFGDYTSRSYILANTLKSGVDNGKEPTDADFVGSRTDHYMDGDKAKLDETVKDAAGSNVTNKTSTGTVTTITDGTTTTKTEQGVKDITNTAKNGTITNDAKDIVNIAKDTITNTAGTSITNQVNDSKVTTDANGTTFENNTPAVSDGGATTTQINGNQITTGRVNANELDVSDTDGNNKADLLVKAGEGVKASASDGNTTGSLDVKADGITTSITNGTDHNTVSSTLAGGTIFSNSGAAAPVTGASGDGTHLNTTVKGNTITTGKVTMDYAEVMKDLGVHGSAKVDNNLEVGGTTTTKTLNVTENATVGGTLDVTQRATFHDAVDIAKDLSVGGNATIAGDVTAKSYKVGDKTYIDANGINANNQKITNVADGSISEGSKDAVNGGQLYTVKNDLEGKVNKVGANAAAMANLHPMEFDPDSKWNVAAAIGNYGSETAAALGAFYRPNDDVMVNLSTAFGTGENMVGGGVSVRLGKGGNKLSREENNALKDQVNDLTARMDALLSVLNPNMSKDFPDVPENHWAYEAVSRLAGNDIVQGYPDGEFHGERTMTRYEMAEIIYNALSRGAEAEKELVEEFKPELQAMAASEKATAERAEG